MNTLVNKSNQRIIIPRLEKAQTLITRLLGLLGRKTLQREEGLYIKHCNSIHTFFMNFPIDVIFVDRSLKVKKVVQHVKPWRLVLPVIGAVDVIEVQAGLAQPELVKEGDQLHVGD